MSSDFYVYVHRKLTDGKPFYVGKGKNRRAYKKHGRSILWQRIVNKHGYSVEIIFNNLTEEEAFQCEKDAILEFKYFGYSLCNFTIGGEGLSGYVPTIEHKKKISLALQGKKKKPESIEKTRLGSLGIKRTPEQLIKWSEAQVGNTNREDTNSYIFYSDNDVFIGTRRSFEKYANLRHLEINCLFKLQHRKTNKPHSGWYLLNGMQLLILNSFFKEN